MVSTIFSVIMGLFKGRAYVLYLLAGLVVSGGLGYGYYTYTSMQKKIAYQTKEITFEKMRVDEVKNQLNALQVVNNSNIQKLKDMELRYKKTIAILTKKAKHKEIKIRYITKIKTRIKYVKAKDNGIAAPILRDTLKRLYQLQTNAPKDSNSTKDNNPKSGDTDATTTN